MAKKAANTSTTTRKTTAKARPSAAQARQRSVIGWIGLILLRTVTITVVTVALLVFLFAFVNPPITHTIWSEQRRLGSVERTWVAFEDIAPAMARSVVAAEDANFCLHWGFDIAAIRAAMDAGANRGASTLSQQTVKNVFLWQGRSWVRKALETAITPAVEAVWSKRRILEIYMNVAEFDEGVFGVGSAAQHYFGMKPDALSDRQAALLAAVLPSPKTRSAKSPSRETRRRASAIADGAATIRADGRSACFED